MLRRVSVFHFGQVQVPALLPALIFIRSVCRYPRWLARHRRDVDRRRLLALAWGHTGSSRAPSQRWIS